MKRLFFLIILIIALMPVVMYAQSDTTKAKADAVWAVYPSFSYQFPGGDLADRFGNSSTIGPGFFHKTASNWVFNADLNFIFGNHIREDSIIQNLINSDGFVIDDQGHYAEVTFFERGFYSSFKVGKLIPVFGTNRNSGILIMAGGGYMQHKINIEVKNKAASPLKGDYKKGYDRLTDGFITSQFIGYMYLGKSRLANFFVGAEFVQGWTKNRRSMDFDTMRRDDKKRFDLLSGFKVGWIIPFNSREPEDFYYY
ncbi:MAG: hypothetical protein K9H16_14495 [Bacteroidales bacterium]|nr:hypothetical protein [Bacteroidales bacterium]